MATLTSVGKFIKQKQMITGITREAHDEGECRCYCYCYHHHHRRRRRRHRRLSCNRPLYLSDLTYGHHVEYYL